MGWVSRPRWDSANQRWYCRVNGKVKPLGRGIDETEALRRWVERGYAAGTFVPAKNGPPAFVAEACALWLEVHGGSEKTRRWRRYLLDCWTQRAGDRRLADLDVDHLRWYAQRLQEEGSPEPNDGNLDSWRANRGGNKAQTVQHKVNGAHRVLAWCVKRGWLASCPDLPKLPKATRSPKDLSEGQLVKLVDELPESTRPIILFIVATGCRPGEACALRWCDVDLDAGVCRPEQFKTKGRTEAPRVIFITPAAERVLKLTRKQWEERGGKGEDHVFLNRLHKAFSVVGLRSVLRRRGIRGGSYILRHTFAQRALPVVGGDVVGKLLGHADGRMVKVYARVKDAQAAAAASSLRLPPRVEDGLDPASAEPAVG